MTRRRLAASAALTLAAVLVVAAAAPAKTRVGTARADVLRGTNGADKLYGRGGADRLHGLRGNDRLFGGAGTDRLYAGAGRDRVVCGGGRDVAFVDARDSVSGCETVRRSGATRPPSDSPPVLRGGALTAGTYVAPLSPRFTITVGPRLEGGRHPGRSRPYARTWQRRRDCDAHVLAFRRCERRGADGAPRRERHARQPAGGRHRRRGVRSTLRLDGAQPAFGGPDALDRAPGRPVGSCLGRERRRPHRHDQRGRADG